MNEVLKDNTINKLYCDPERVRAFWTLRKLQTAAKQMNIEKKPSVLNSWLERQDAYTQHRPVRKRFPRNPYDVTNRMGVWESDLIDVRNVSKFNNTYKYLL